MSSMDALILFGPLLVLAVGMALAMGVYHYFCRGEDF